MSGLNSLCGMIAHHAVHTPSAIALVFEGRETHYAALDARMQGAAHALKKRGLKAGDRIAFLGKNSDDYFVLLFGAAAAGVVLVPLNWRLAMDEWRYILEDAGATHLFADADYLDQANALAATTGLKPVIALAGLGGEGDYPLSASDPDPEAVILQLYTSGTTGRPKGVQLTHRNVLALRAPGYAAGLDWFPTATDASLVVLPVAHIAGTAYGLFGFYGGGRVIIARDFDPAGTLALLQSARVTHMLLAPAAMRLLVEHPMAQGIDLPHFRCLTYGASPIPEALLRQCIATFSCRFVQMYGMTEASGGVVALTPEDHEADDPTRLLSAGRAMPGAQVAIIDGAGRHLAVGEIGEIAVRSAAVMRGYWQRPEATAEVIDADGWLRSGDIGRMDALGYVFVMDRAKDMIISGGENIYPAEVENAIFGHPDVAEVAVIGVPSHIWGEEAMAVVVPRPGHVPDASAIQDWARSRIAAFKVPKSVTFIDALPRNASGKVLRRALRDIYWTEGGRQIG